MIKRTPTSLLAAAGLIGGYGAASVKRSRKLGGVVMAGCGLPCIYVWTRRDGRATATGLTAFGLAAFAASHGLGPRIGAWPSVFVVSAATAAASWRWSDSRWIGRDASAK